MLKPEGGLSVPAWSGEVRRHAKRPVLPDQALLSLRRLLFGKVDLGAHPEGGRILL